MSFVFAEDTEEKAKKEAEENSQQGIDDKKMEENEGKKTSEDNITMKSEKSKQGNKEGSSGDSKSTEINTTNINGSRPTGGDKHGTSQGKNVTDMEKGGESKRTGEESKQQAQNGKCFCPFMEK